MQWWIRFAKSPRPMRLLIVVIALSGTVKSASGVEAHELFEERIRPVLVEHCYECHSAASEPAEGGLRLDTRAGVQQGGNSGPVVVPGDVESSRLILALRYEDDALQMPPAGKLPDTVIRDFESWVTQGSIDPRDERIGTVSTPTELTAAADLGEAKQFWAFRPLHRAQAPAAGKLWGRDPLDQFVAVELRRVGLTPAPPADPRTRVRRLFFDLTGVPPAPEQVAAFGRDESPATWTQLVDNLLSTRACAEHWARHWLDIVRYADSNGNDFNATYHEAWRYRNYIIDAFAADKPFDQMVREQIAGDLLPYGNDAQRAEQLIATGFLTLGPKMLSERDKLKLRLDVVDDQIDTYGKSLLALTLGCARCHDHKFDPISSNDYYALAGIFWNAVTLDGEIQQYVSDWVELELPLANEHAARLAEHAGKTKAMETRIKEVEDQRAQLQLALDRAAFDHDGLVVDNREAELTGDWTKSQSVKGFVGHEYLHDGNRAKGETSAAFVANVPRRGEYEVRIAYTAGMNRATNVPVEVHHQDGTERLTVDQRRPAQPDRLFQPLGTYSFEEGSQQVVTISNANTDGHVVVDAIQMVPVDNDSNAERESGRHPQDIDAQQLADLRSNVGRLQSESRELKEELDRLKQLAPPPPPRAMTVREVEPASDIERRLRGIHSHLGPIVPRGFLRVLADDDASLRDPSQSGRLELAHWTTSVAHPLLARVFVNRVWYHLIGAGIVRSCDNFGQLGDKPTHPELLDMLAADFIAHGWSVKYLVRRIVLSQTYQSAVVTDDRAAAIDPENRLLWSAHRKRLTAEQLRDSILLVSQSLDSTPAESPVAHLGRLVNNNSASEAAFERQESLKRSVYLPVVRNELPDLLTAFDFADPDRVVGRRPETNVPAQALLLLNHPLMQQMSKRVAERMLNHGEDDLTRLTTLYQLLFQRNPRPEEVQRDRAFLAATIAEWDGASDALTIAWTQLCHALLASTEFRYLD